jgi:hypothetical protein
MQSFCAFEWKDNLCRCYRTEVLDDKAEKANYNHPSQSDTSAKPWMWRHWDTMLLPEKVTSLILTLPARIIWVGDGVRAVVGQDVARSTLQISTLASWHSLVLGATHGQHGCAPWGENATAKKRALREP